MAYCDENFICQCPPGQVYNIDGTDCLDLVVGHGAPCIDDNQCSWLLGRYVCSRGACACDDGWWYYNGRCRRAAGLGQSCNSTENCYNGYDILAMVCSNGICTCSSDYYLRGNYDCRPKAQEAGDYCSLDSDCASLGDDYVCKVAACVFSPTTIAPTTIAPTTIAPTTIAPTTIAPTTIAPTTNSPTTIPPTTIAPTTNAPITIAPTTNAPTTIAPDTTTLTSTESSLSDLISDSSQEVLQAAERSALLSITERATTNISCVDTSDCTNVTENSVCYYPISTCVCKRGYYYNSGSGLCIPEIGVYSGCTSDTDCGISTSRCLNGSCYCRKTYFTLPGNFACQKPMAIDNLWCNNVERCYVMGTSVSCRNNQCSCTSNAVLDEDYICRVTVNITETPTGCSSDWDCRSELQNSVCSNGECVCPSNYRLENSVCLPNLGATCDGASALCTINHASCTSANLCQCDTNYIASENATTCYQVAEGLGANCQKDLQCLASVNDSVCLNDVCTCADNYKDIEGNCFLMKAIGDRCSNVLECRVTLGENVYCRKGICQCPANMIRTDDGLDCINSGTAKPHFSFYSTTAVILLTFSVLWVQ
ncbi:mucin-5AC-like isoform X2 [Agrilus planipennis]|nr:mucin-5AC-like isoform X2 [Agrilus planipennis]XP_025834736.1 mucin-5AC-like isoform X2 [Agrilus planipennis]XP_025834737.1 mucin-5AC-like isoform X2 [Agrilus planipennis]